MKIIFAIVISILLYDISAYAEEPELVFAFSEHELFPYQLGKEIEFPKNNPGIYVEAVRFIGRRVPVKVTIKRIPTKRIWSELEYGTVSSTGASYKTSREQFVVYPQKLNGAVDQNRSLLTATYALFIQKLISGKTDYRAY